MITVFKKIPAGRRGDNKAEGHRKPKVGHFTEIRALASQQVPIVTVALIEKVNALCHGLSRCCLQLESRSASILFHVPCVIYLRRQDDYARGVIRGSQRWVRASMSATRRLPRWRCLHPPRPTQNMDVVHCRYCRFSGVLHADGAGA